MADWIEVRGAKVHNLKNIDVRIPKDRYVVITGLSGSGKSSLAFDTLFAEGQRRFVESLSAYARQFLGQMDKPDVESITGLSPAIAIDQRSASGNPRSTVATTTEVYDYLRLLFARIGDPFCPKCGRPVCGYSVDEIVRKFFDLPEGERVQILAPVVRGRKGEFSELFAKLRMSGFARVRIDGQIFYLEDAPKLDKKHKHSVEVVVDRLTVKAGLRDRVTSSIETALTVGEGRVTFQIGGEEGRPAAEHLFSNKLSCPNCDVSLPEIEPRTFSFNSPYGACESCSGLGSSLVFDESLIIGDEGKSISDGAIFPLRNRESFLFRQVEALAGALGFSLTDPYKTLKPDIRKAVLYGDGDRELTVHIRKKTRTLSYRTDFPGVIPYLVDRYENSNSLNVRTGLRHYMAHKTCDACRGARLRPEALAIRIAGKNISEVNAMTIAQARQFSDSLSFTGARAQIATPILKEIRARLGFMEAIGLAYLTLDRKVGTLSGGEAQRIKLSTQIGSALSGVLYVLDEPSIGLHQRDNARLLDTLKRLRDLGNTVIVVEHDEQFIRESDYIVDMGPAAGEHGGQIVFSGTPADLMRSETLTARYLRLGARKIDVPSINAPPRRFIEIRGAAEHNLKNITVAVPLGRLVAVTGVSGSGKSTLIYDVLYNTLARALHNAHVVPGACQGIQGMRQVDKVINVDQSPIGRTPRSNPATYTGLFAFIRALFSSLPDSKIRGFTPGRFSFNVAGGRCERCEGDGVLRIEMQFLSDLYVKCDVCHGKRYNTATLDVKYHEKTIADVLDMPIDEAYRFFARHPQIVRRLKLLKDVGLGYLRLGQRATTLSGGENQRVKLAAELGRPDTQNTLYLLDEPTTGLHFADVQQLVPVLRRLVSAGNTVIVIEHNLDVIGNADWVIDLGPEGGDRGGEMVFAGPPAELARHPTSHTGKFLKDWFADSRDVHASPRMAIAS